MRRKLLKNPYQIEQKTTPDRWKCVLGAFSAPNCAQVGFRTLPPKWGTPLFIDFWNIIWIFGPIFGAPGNRRSLQNRTFEGRLGLWPSKNALWEGVWKKHENCMKNRCQNRRFLMAQNHVWRYTLRLFYTFAIFEKYQKNDAKMDAKSCHFWFKNWSWAPQGRLILPSLIIFDDSKNHWFFDVSLGRQKINKNRSTDGFGGSLLWKRDRWCSTGPPREPPFRAL